MAAPLLIRPLASTSPTLAEDMKLCRLRAGLASCREAASWVLHDPRLWLGMALHSLLDKGRREHITDLEAAWDSEIAGFVQRIGSHQFDQRFSDPSRWPAYFLVRQRALSSAAEVNAARRPSGASGGERPPVRSGTEQRLVARSGRLVGRPDRFDRYSVVDIKSNLPDRTTPAGAEIFQRNRRQIQIYAAIIAESLGFWPKKGIIAGASGETAEFGLAPAECNDEADAAVADLAAWNRALSSAARASDIAGPSDLSCGTCRFQLVCPAFWTWLARPSVGNTAPKFPVAADGSLKSIQLGSDGDLQTIALEDVVSTQPGMVSTNLVTRCSIHGPLPMSAVGSDCRIVGAQVRRDGRLVTDVFTVIILKSEVPQIVIRAETVPDHPPSARE